MSSEHFAADLTSAIATYRPILVQLDPLYVYFGEDREAGNVFNTGPALSRLRELCQGIALQVAHHFTKAGADRLTLASLTQAGMREAVDHWLLISVREFDLVEQRFKLDMDRGARRGLAWSRQAEIHPRTVRPRHPQAHRRTARRTHRPVQGHQHRQGPGVCPRRDRRRRTRPHRPRRDVQGRLPTMGRRPDQRRGRRREETRRDREAIRVGALRTEDGPNRSILHFWAKEYPEDDDG